MIYIRSWYHQETEDVVERYSVEKDYRADEYPASMDEEAEEIAQEDWEERGAIGTFEFEYWEEISAEEFRP